MTPTDSQRTSMLAYQIWEQEGRPAGREQHHWQQAEKQLQVEFRVGFPDATGDEDPGHLSSPDSGRATSELQQRGMLGNVEQPESR